MYVEQLLRRLDEICRHLLDSQEVLRKGVYRLLEPDVRAEIERLSQSCKQILRWTQADFDIYARRRVVREVELSSYFPEQVSDTCS
jgi:hypothetical protein